MAKKVLVHQHARRSKRSASIGEIGTVIEKTGKFRTKDGKEYKIVKLEDLLKEMRKEGAKKHA